MMIVTFDGWRYLTLDSIRARSVFGVFRRSHLLSASVPVAWRDGRLCDHILVVVHVNLFLLPPPSFSPL